MPAAAMIDIIPRDEVGYVEIGNSWYRYLYEQRVLDPQVADAEFALRYDAPRLKGPCNLDARRRAGFTEAELRVLFEWTPMSHQLASASRLSRSRESRLLF